MAALPGTTGRRRIYLMRHGHVDYFRPEVAEHGPRMVPLTALGREQADAAGLALAHVRFDVALCSGLPRTRQTAEIVLARNEAADHLTLEEDFDLEEIRGGRLLPEARSREELAARLTFAFDRAHEPGATMGEGGEVFADVLARVSGAVERLLARPGWHTALVAAHEGVNRLILGWMTGNGLRAVQAFEQDLACINVLDFDLVPKESGQGTEIARAIIKTVNATAYNWTKHGMNLTSLEAIFALAEKDAAQA